MLEAGGRDGGGPPGGRRPTGFLVFLAALVTLIHASALGNAALLNHPPNPFRDALLDDSLLQGTQRLGGVLGREFLVRTYGEYQPLGHAAIGVLSQVVPPNAFWWRLTALLLHVATSMVVFLFVLRLTRRTWGSLALSLAYAVQPGAAILINDINFMHGLVALFFGACCLALLGRYLGRSGILWLVLAVVAFCAALLASQQALLLAGMVVALCLLHERHATFAAVFLVLSALAGVALVTAMRVPVTLASGGLAVASLVIGVGMIPARRALRSALPSALPFIVLGAAFAALWEHITPLPLGAVLLATIRAQDMDVPFRADFVLRTMVEMSPAYMAVPALLAAIGILAMLPRRWAGVAAFAGCGILACLTRSWGGHYKSDAAYWAMLRNANPAPVSVEYNLAVAHVQARDWAAARDTLLRLRYERTLTPTYQDLTANLLGQTYEGLGDRKIAGYYFFSPSMTIPVSQTYKQCLVAQGDFCLRTGYLSNAECVWARAIIVDPDDARIYNRLGAALMYKNFFRAAKRHFEHALQLDRDNQTALYHLAFIAKVAGDTESFTSYRNRWQRATGIGTGPDFQPIYDAYCFDRDRLRSWFSGDPFDFQNALGAQDVYRFDCQGATYAFPEVPAEIGRYFAAKGRSDESARWRKLAAEIGSAPVRQVAPAGEVRP
jgi:tetratricopeptide (TPR) repeat protein